MVWWDKLKNKSADGIIWKEKVVSKTMFEEIRFLIKIPKTGFSYLKLIFTKELFNKTRNKYQETVNFGQSIQGKSMVTKTGY